MATKINPTNISYIDQLKTFGFGFMVTSLLGDVSTSIKLVNADLYEKNYEKAKEREKEIAEKKATKEAAKAERVAAKKAAKDKMEEVKNGTSEDISDEAKAEIIEFKDSMINVEIKEGGVVVEDTEYNFSTFDDDVLDTNIEDAITTLNNINPRTVKLSVLGILFIGKVINTEQVMKRLDNTKLTDDLEFLNTFTKFYTGLIMSPGYNSYMINEIFENMKDLEAIVKFEAAYDKVGRNDAIDHVIEKSRELMIEFERATMKADGDPDPDPVVPIMFVNKNMDLIRHQNVKKDQVNTLEKALAGVIERYQYQFNGIGGLIELVIHSNDRMDSYRIDPGTIIGNGYNLIYSFNGVDYFINLKHTDIVAKLLENKYYMLTPEEFQIIAQDMFTNGAVYAMVDMSKGPEILPKLSPEEFNKLGKKLTSILNLDWSNYPNGQDGKIPKTRLRFRSFKSIDDFVLVSDNKCKSPLPGTTWEVFADGLTVKVVGDEITVKLGTDYERKYDIIYNEM